MILKTFLCFQLCGVDALLFQYDNAAKHKEEVVHIIFIFYFLFGRTTAQGPNLKHPIQPPLEHRLRGLVTKHQRLSGSKCMQSGSKIW